MPSARTQAPPSIASRARRRPGHQHGLLFAVYAPFGTDPVLSSYPDGVQRRIDRQPLIRHLRKVAAQGVNVAALIDLVDDDTWLVEIPAGQPDQAAFCPVWKQAMHAPQALAGFLRRAHFRFACSHLVLALEGHGAGYLPDIDAQLLSPERSSDGGQTAWRIGSQGSAPFDEATGDPVLGVSFFPELPVDSPEVLPVTLPMSTAALAHALARARRAGVPRPAVIHFNNCFNMSLEHLHTVAPHADFATGYANYNFFTAGQAYPHVFERLRLAGSASAEQVARWFALANHALLAAKGNHPTVGATIRLSRMKPLAQAVERMADALTSALQPADPTDRPPVLARVRAAVIDAMQYDTDGDYALEVPDQVSDLGTLAGQLQRQFPSGPVHDAAAAVVAALAGVWQYGDFERPHMDETRVWDFRDQRLGMNLLLPDPLLEGRWDWRSPYYMAGQVNPAKPPALKQQIPFLADRAGGQRAPWPAFVEEYHRDVTFKGLLRIRPPQFPVFDRRFQPKYPPPDDRGDACGPPGKA